jgi:hypothetical protein
MPHRRQDYQIEIDWRFGSSDFWRYRVKFRVAWDAEDRLARTQGTGFTL